MAVSTSKGASGQGSVCGSSVCRGIIKYNEHILAKSCCHDLSRNLLQEFVESQPGHVFYTSLQEDPVSRHACEDVDIGPSGMCSSHDGVLPTFWPPKPPTTPNNKVSLVNVILKLKLAVPLQPRSIFLSCTFYVIAILVNRLQRKLLCCVTMSIQKSVTCR